MKLPHAPMSARWRRVPVTVAILGTTIEENLFDLRFPEHRVSLRALHPNEKLPVLEDGELVLWESHAIMQYLCNKTPDQRLYPVEIRRRADVERWLFWISSHLSPVVGGISFERMWKKLIGLGGPDPAQLASDEAGVHQLAAQSRAAPRRTHVDLGRCAVARRCLGGRLVDVQRARSAPTRAVPQRGRPPRARARARCMAANRADVDRMISP